jgi:hypothetical protein
MKPLKLDGATQSKKTDSSLNKSNTKPLNLSTNKSSIESKPAEDEEEEDDSGEEDMDITDSDEEKDD